MKTKKTNAIVLRKVPYKENSIILTLFSEKEGLLSLFVKHTGKKHAAIFNPLSEAEFVYRSKNTEQYFFVDASIIDLHLSLRNSLDSLETASKMVKHILKTQLPGKPAPRLYLLFSLYLKKIPDIKDPNLLLISFVLKALYHDGQLDLSDICSKCSEKAIGLFQGESFCLKDLPHLGLRFSEEEWKTLQKLLTMKSFDELNFHSNNLLNEKFSKLISR